MADETTSAPSTRDLMAEVEKSRESSARLLETLARKVGAPSAPVPAHSPLKSVALGLERAVRSRPGAALAIAIVAGYLAGRAVGWLTDSAPSRQRFD